MKAAIGSFIGLVLSVSVRAEPLIEGWVRLESGESVAAAQVRLFDMTDLQRGALARATTDGTGYFALPLANLGGRALPARFALGANYPNPFNPSTLIPYQLAASSAVRLEVFNLLGQRIATLVDGEQSAGLHTATWHATDGAGRAVGAGVYIYRMTVGAASQTGRMVLLDGQAGVSSAGAASAWVGASGGGADGEQVYGLVVSGEGLAPYVDSSFRVEAGMAPVELVVSAGPHSAGKITDDDFLDLFGAFNDQQEEAADETTARAQADEPDIAAWLTEHPRVSQAIAWEDSQGITAYPNWSAAQKADLYRTFHTVWNGQSLELTDPPPNMRADLWTVLSEDHAWSLFLAHISFSLAVETGQWVPWSLMEYSDEELLELFDGSRIFRWADNYGGYETLSDIPAPPDVTFEFLNEYLMIGQDKLDTIENLLEWSRAKMRHYYYRYRSPGEIESAMEAFVSTWHYRGRPPVSRVIQGTIRRGESDVEHWVAGCHGVTGFLHAVLRVVNIPVENVIVQGHSLPYFMSEDLYLSHGDDIHSQTTRSSPGFPIAELFLDQATFDTRFGRSVSDEEQLNNIDRRSNELGIKYLPLSWLREYCREDFNRGIPYAESYIYTDWSGLDRNYTVEELQSVNFWGRMEAKINSLGGCPIKDAWIDIEPRPPTIQKISGTISAADNLLVVEVRDSEGRAIKGHLVTFSVTAGGGTLSAIRTTTDAMGRAETRLTLGPDVGTTRVSAFAAGVVDPVTFTN